MGTVSTFHANANANSQVLVSLINANDITYGYRITNTGSGTINLEFGGQASTDQIPPNVARDYWTTLGIFLIANQPAPVAGTIEFLGVV